MENKKIKTGSSFIVVSDIVKKVYPWKVYAKLSPHYQKEIWILECENNRIQVLDEHLESKDFIKEIETGLALSKKFKFTLVKRGKYLVRVEQIKN